METRDVWVVAYVLAHQVHTCAWASALVLGTPQRTCGAWATLGVTHAHALLGDTWCLGHIAGPKIPGS